MSNMVEFFKQKIKSNLLVADYLVLAFCLFGILYGAVYYKSFAEGKIRQPSRFTVTEYHKSKGAHNYQQMVELGFKEGYYSADHPAPKQETLSLWHNIRFFLMIASSVFFFRLVVPANNPFFRFLRNWYLYFLVPVSLFTVGWLGQVVFDNLPYDYYLAEADRLMFGSNLALDFFPAIKSWWIDEYLSLAYFNFYYLGLLVGIPVYLKCSSDEFNHFMTVLILGFLLNFFLTAIIPAAGPIFHYADGIRFPFFPGGQMVDHSMGPIATLMRSLIYTGEIPAGAIPSSHCSIALIVAIFAFKYLNKLWGGFFLFWAASLWVSTIYLQQHYLIDVLAGLIITYGGYYRFGTFLHNHFQPKVTDG